MFSWFRALFSARAPVVGPATNGYDFDEELTDVQVENVNSSLKALIEAGIKLGSMYDGMSLRDIAIEMLENCFHLPADACKTKDARLPGLPYFVLTQARDGDDFEGFRNVARFEDHCYDGATNGTYVDVISRAISLAGSAWNVQGAVIHDARGMECTPDFGRPVKIAIKAQPPVSPFELIHNKNFDWSLIDRLNERLPADAEGRFAAAFDGSATLFFVTPQQLVRLSEVCGFDHFYTTEKDSRAN